jgi:hypothetical protein
MFPSGIFIAQMHGKFKHSQIGEVLAILVQQSNKIAKPCSSSKDVKSKRLTEMTMKWYEMQKL